MNFPLAALSYWVVPIARSLPLTHGLKTVRGIVDGIATGPILRNIGIEALIGAAWLIAAIPVFWWLAEQDRRDGTIEFGA